MGQGISAVLTFAIGVAISPMPIIAVILMLFSQRATGQRPGLPRRLGRRARRGQHGRLRRVARRQRGADEQHGVGLGVVGHHRPWRRHCSPWPAATGASARRRGRSPSCRSGWRRSSPLSPVKALGLGVALAAVNPKNLILTAGAAAGLAQVSGLTTTDAVVAIAVFVVIASLTIAGPVHLLAGRRGEGEGLPRLGQGLAHRAQRRGDGRAVPRLRRRPDRQGPPAADALSQRPHRSRLQPPHPEVTAANWFLAFQTYETLLFVVAHALLGSCCTLWVRRRLN